MADLRKPSLEDGNERPQRHGIFHLLGTMFLWCLSLFLLICTIASFFSGSLLTSIFPFFMTLLFLPVRPVQTFFRSKLRIRSIKKAAVVVCLFFAWVFTFPSSTPQEPTDSPAAFQPVNESVSLESDEESAKDTSEPSDESSDSDTDTSDAQTGPKEEVPAEEPALNEEAVVDESSSTASVSTGEILSAPLEETPAEEPVQEQPAVEEQPVVDETPTSAPVETPAEPPVQSKPQSRTVYITSTGKRYHYNSNCGRGNYYASTLDEAVSMGLTPCKKCAGG